MEPRCLCWKVWEAEKVKKVKKVVEAWNLMVNEGDRCLYK